MRLAIIVLVGCWLLLSAAHGSHTIVNQPEEIQCVDTTTTCPPTSR